MPACLECVQRSSKTFCADGQVYGPWMLWRVFGTAHGETWSSTWLERLSKPPDFIFHWWIVMSQTLNFRNWIGILEEYGFCTFPSLTQNCIAKEDWCMVRSPGGKSWLPMVSYCCLIFRFVCTCSNSGNSLVTFGDLGRLLVFFWRCSDLANHILNAASWLSHCRPRGNSMDFSFWPKLQGLLVMKIQRVVVYFLGILK